jgi:polysaccharide export outer membrane protein
MRAWVGLLSAMTALVLLLGCAGGSIDRPGVEPTQQASVERSEYRLGPGDALRVKVFDQEELSGEFTITPQGTIAYPLIGEIKAEGMTLSEFARGLEGRLRQGYVRAPRASAEVLNYRPFFILGEVNKPGTYPFAANLSVVNAVATAGGFTVRADVRRVFIKRIGETVERDYQLTSAISVQPGDTLRVPERRF